jgi:ATP-dependent DNA helicase PIF1
LRRLVTYARDHGLPPFGVTEALALARAHPGPPLLAAAAAAAVGGVRQTAAAATAAAEPQSLRAFLEERGGAQLSDTQVRFLHSTLHLRQSLFLTGGAGSGKSHVVQLAVEYARLLGWRVAVTAPTGTAAQLVGGTTLHAFLGVPHTLPPVAEFVQALRRQPKSPRSQRWLTTDLLIIDELSMVTPDLFVFLCRVAEQVRRPASAAARSDEERRRHPLGSLQLVGVGDFCQLPPVLRGGTEAADRQRSHQRAGVQHLLLDAAAVAAVDVTERHLQLVLAQRTAQLPPPQHAASATAAPQFCFETREWDRVFPLARCLQLQQIFRQTGGDSERLVVALNEIRLGRVSPATDQLLRTRLLPPPPVGPAAAAAAALEPPSTTTHLVTHRAQADTYNRQQLARLRETVHSFEAQLTTASGRRLEAAATADGGEASAAVRALRALCPVDGLLLLKVGARVMLCVNLSTELGLVNGATGTVRAVGDAQQRQPTVHVQFDRIDGGVVELEWHRWSVDGSVGGEVLWQMPLVLAWALTVHKSQGLSLDRATIDCSQAFAAGQMYVALSRPRSLAGLQLTHWQPDGVRADPRVLRFYAALCGGAV